LHLLKQKNDDDYLPGGGLNPACVLKMTCPSTGFIHAIRVPPEMLRAKEAVYWVNWETDPESFVVET
jgi:internalin A